MAIPTRPVIYGVDVSQRWLDICQHGSPRLERVTNDPTAIRGWLKRLPPTAALAVEATNTYHERLVEAAVARGLAVYVVSGYQLKHYARSLNVRMRTDAVDARLLARFLDREIDELRPYQPPPPQQQRLIRLLKRRALLVKQIQQLRQSFVEVPELKRAVDSLIRRIQALITRIDSRLQQLANQLGWRTDLARLRRLPGVGPLNALALCAAYRSGQFTHRDPFIAFLGLDVRSKDSGQHQGRRKLTKKGNPEYRRLLYNAAMSAARHHGHFTAYYHNLQRRGLSKTAALVAIARKIARLAFALLKNQTTFCPQHHLKACAPT